MYRVIMPALEMAQDTGTLLRWLKSEGEQVQRGEPLMEIETDKVTLEIESGGSGVLTQVSAGPGDEVPVGQVIALLLAEGEKAESLAPKPVPLSRLSREPLAGALTPNPVPPESGALTPNPSSRRSRREPFSGRGALSTQVAASPLARRLAAEHGVDLSELPATSGRISKADVLAWLQREAAAADQRVLASPKARRLAAEQGIELATLAGRGPQGAVLAGDVQAAAPEVAAAPTVIAADAAAADDEVLRVVPLTGMRGAIAARTQASARTAPHISLTLSADMSEALRLQQQLGPAVQAASGHKLTLTTLLARAVVATLKTHSRLNAHLLKDEIREFRPVHLGVAVALADGLLVPVMRDCDTLGLAQLQASLQQLAERARARTLTTAELRGATFTLSNLGMYGIEHFSAIINPPEVAILAVGAVQERVVAVAGQAVVRPMLQLTINVDHRAVDGAVAAAFLRDLKNLLENPWSLLV